MITEREADIMRNTGSTSAKRRRSSIEPLEVDAYLRIDAIHKHSFSEQGNACAIYRATITFTNAVKLRFNTSRRHYFLAAFTIAFSRLIYSP